MIPSKGELLPAAVEFPVMSHIQFRLNKDNTLSVLPWWSIAGSLPSSIGDTGLLPCLGTKIPRLRATLEPKYHNERSLHSAVKSPHPATKT